MTAKILEGVKIADFTRVIVGPLTTKSLTEYGADLIRIEGRSSLDFFRTSGPEPDLAAQFTQWNTDKKGISINLAKPEGKEIAKKIVAWADVVVENFAGGVMERLGLGYEELKKVNPDIIMLSSCMQGQTGPFAKHPGWGFQLSALSGFSGLTGHPDREPPELGVYTDFITPLYNVSLILSALLYRNRTGKGMYIDTAQLETGLHFISPLLLDFAVNGRVADRAENKAEFAAPHDAYRCMDKETFCSIPVESDENWVKFCEATGHAGWAADERFSTAEARKTNRAELDELFRAWTKDVSVDEIMGSLFGTGLKINRAKSLADKVVENELGPYQCMGQERWCAIVVTNDREWKSFCEVTGIPSLQKNPKFATIAARKENEEELDAIVSAWTAVQVAEDVMTRLQEAGVGAGICETGEDQLENDPQTKHRRMFRELDHPRLGTHHAMASPFHMSKAPVELTRAPLLGEHNEYVLKELLGYTDEDVVNLVVEGVLE